VACRPDLSTGSFSVDAVAYVAGRVTTTDGFRLKGAQVAVQPQREGQLYALNPAHSDANGNFRYTVRRMGRPQNVSDPDTVTATVTMGFSSRAPGAALPPSQRTSVLLTFAPPSGTDHRAAIADFRVALPRPYER
jgi:hypothetical protein